MLQNLSGYQLTFVKNKPMEKNIGYNDRMTRAALAIVIGVLCLTQIVTGPATLYLLVIAELLLLSSSLSFCPVYKMVKINNHNN